MSVPAHVGIDVGGTASRWVACDQAGAILARGQAAGATGHVFNPAEKERLRAALGVVAVGLAEAGLVPVRVAAGLTGFGAVVADETRALFGAALGVAGDDILVVDDMILSYAAIFAPGEGHLISAGTGSIGLHIGPEDYVRVGGRGILIDDAGSGSWIALRALDRMFRHLDRDGSFEAVPALARHLFSVVGGEDWHAVRHFVYGGDRGRIGTLAVGVARAAEDGDETAMAILREAGGALAELGLALTARTGRRPIGFIGGVLGLHPSIGEAIRKTLPGHELRFVTADAALTAARLHVADQQSRRDMLTTRSSLG